MNERVEAAANTLWKALDAGSREWTEEVAKETLAAADAVMFSDEAVERAGYAVDDFTMHQYGHAIPLEDRNKLVAAVIAALKGR